jgi:hypothetical protein
MVEGVDVAGKAFVVGMHDEVEPKRAHGPVAEGDHVAELPGGVHVQQRERQLRRPEGLAREMQQHGRIFAD